MSGDSNSQSDEERAHGTVSLKTYYEYFKAGGGHVFTLFVLGLFIFVEVGIMKYQSSLIFYITIIIITRE